MKEYKVAVHCCLKPVEAWCAECVPLQASTMLSLVRHYQGGGSTLGMVMQHQAAIKELGLVPLARRQIHRFVYDKETRVDRLFKLDTKQKEYVSEYITCWSYDIKFCQDLYKLYKSGHVMTIWVDKGDERCIIDTTREGYEVRPCRLAEKLVIMAPGMFTLSSTTINQ